MLRGIFKAVKTAIILSIRAFFKFKGKIVVLIFICWFKFRKVVSQNRVVAKIGILRLLQQQISRLLLAKFSNPNLKNRNLKVRYLVLVLNLKEVILPKREFEPFKLALFFKSDFAEKFDDFKFI